MQKTVACNIKLQGFRLVLLYQNGNESDLFFATYVEYGIVWYVGTV